MQEVRPGVLRVGQRVQVVVREAHWQLLEKLGRSHNLHEGTDAVFPGIVGMSWHLELRDYEKEITALLRLQR